jgi:hypothetical protein
MMRLRKAVSRSATCCLAPCAMAPGDAAPVSAGCHYGLHLSAWITHFSMQYAPSRTVTPAPTGAAPTPIPGLTAIRSTGRSALSYQIARPLVCLVLQGSKHVAMGSQSYTFHAGDSLLITADVPTVSQITQASLAAPYYSLVLDLDPAVIAGLATEMAALHDGGDAPRAHRDHRSSRRRRGTAPPAPARAPCFAAGAASLAAARIPLLAAGRTPWRGDPAPGTAGQPRAPGRARRRPAARRISRSACRSSGWRR